MRDELLILIANPRWSVITKLVDKIERMQFGRIFFIHGRHPEIDTIMEQAVRETISVAKWSGRAVRRGFTLL